VKKGISAPDAENLQKLADVLEVDVRQLLDAEVDTGTDSTDRQVEVQASEEIIVEP